MGPLFPLTLQGRGVRLEPLSLDHVDALWRAASESLETYALTGAPRSPEAARRYVEVALEEAARGLAVPFATFDIAKGRCVGSTRFGNIERWSWPGAPAESVPSGPDAVEIGWTWLAQSAQRTHVNTEAKLLMLGHAFEVWRVRRVTLATDARNWRSRRAIERIGGRLDGILRAHRPAFDGAVRDTAFFSLLAPEWREARDRLAARLAR